MREGEHGAPGAPRWATLSAPGGRPGNEDRAGETATGAGHAFVVADGLGGHAAGELAAEACVAAVCEALRAERAFTPEALRAAFEAAQRAVLAAQARDPAAAGCRTTAVVLALAGDRALWGHVGDSRLYLFRGGRVIHQTLDHSVPEALAQSGAIRPSEIRAHPDRNRLLRSLGGEGEAEPALLESPLALRPGDAFLLCTDGFWELVTEPEMEAALGEAKDPGDWLRRLERGLLAKARGEFDNYTATAVLPAPLAGASRPGLPALVLGLAAALAVALALGRCERKPAGYLLGSAAPAHELPLEAGSPGSSPGPGLHSAPGMPASARGV